MKPTTIIISFFIASIFSAQAQTCDTLKWKTIKTYYGTLNGTAFKTTGSLDGAVINIDTLPIFYPRIDVVNISNDTFYSSETFNVALFCIIHTNDSSYELRTEGPNFFGKNCFPNDTLKMPFNVEYNLPHLINAVKEKSDVDFEDITHWEFVGGFSKTSKDGTYSDSVFYAGANTSIFYVVKGSVGIAETGQSAGFKVFPNPANNQLQVTGYELQNIIFSA